MGSAHETRELYVYIDEPEHLVGIAHLRPVVAKRKGARKRNALACAGGVVLLSN